MDTVRFGRVLGFGARQAAKTLIQAIDAAKAENQSPRPAPLYSSAAPPTKRVEVKPLSRIKELPAAAQRASGVVGHGRGVRRGISQFRDLAVKPFIRLSGVLLLEVVVVFFGIFALYGFNTMWRARTAWHLAAPHHRQFVGGAIVLAIFGYFSVTSFVRARRRERQG